MAATLSSSRHYFRYLEDAGVADLCNDHIVRSGNGVVRLLSFSNGCFVGDVSHGVFLC